MGAKISKCQKGFKILAKGQSHLGQEKPTLLKALEEIQEKIELKEVTKEMVLKEKEIEGKILALQRKEDSELGLKSRCLWVKVGD